MARRITPPFRADHVGSLLRPAALHQVRASYAAGTITADQLRQAEDDAILAAVRMQEETGLQSATDGEFRQAEWHTDFITQLGGFRQAETFRTIHAFGAGQPLSYDAHGMEVTGKVHLAEPVFTPPGASRPPGPASTRSTSTRSTWP
jgi:5-methyltetrahydropteroyltriglutamate--homocysteine methyltransferase